MVAKPVVTAARTGRNTFATEDKVARNTGFQGSYCKEPNGDCTYMKHYMDH